MPEAIRVRIHGSDFILETEKIKEIADGSRAMVAVTDDLKKYTLIVSSDITGKMIQFTPLIRNFKEYKISSDELIQNPSGIFKIPEFPEQIAQNSDKTADKTSSFIVVEPEPPRYVHREPPPLIPPRKFLSQGMRKSLTEKYGEGKADDELYFLQRQDTEILNKKILLEKELEIVDPNHTRTLDLLEDLISVKRHLRNVVGDVYIDYLNFSEYEDLYEYYHELRDSMKSDDWIQYKLTKLMKRRKEMGSRKKFRELDAFLLNQDFH